MGLWKTNEVADLSMLVAVLRFQIQIERPLAADSLNPEPSNRERRIRKA